MSKKYILQEIYKPRDSDQDRKLDLYAFHQEFKTKLVYPKDHPNNPDKEILKLLSATTKTSEFIEATLQINTAALTTWHHDSLH